MLLIIHNFLHDSSVLFCICICKCSDLVYRDCSHVEPCVNHNLRYEIATVRNKVETVRYKLNGCQCRKMPLCESQLGELKKLQLCKIKLQ